MSTRKEIRQLAPAELEEALALVWEVFAEFEAPEYSQEGIEEFWRFIDAEYMIMQVGEGAMTFWGAFEDDYLVGVCAFRGLTHISLLFVDGNPAGVKALLHEMGFIENVLRLPLVPTRITTLQKMTEILKTLKI